MFKENHELANQRRQLFKQNHQKINQKKSYTNKIVRFSNKITCCQTKSSYINQIPQLFEHNFQQFKQKFR
jgi:hemoglobin-like flavoprotein